MNFIVREEFKIKDNRLCSLCAVDISWSCNKDERLLGRLRWWRKGEDDDDDEKPSRCRSFPTANEFRNRWLPSAIVCWRDNRRGDWWQSGCDRATNKTATRNRKPWNPFPSKFWKPRKEPSRRQKRSPLPRACWPFFVCCVNSDGSFA